MFVVDKTGALAACISMLAEKTTAFTDTESGVAMKGERKRGWERVCIGTVQEGRNGSVYRWKGWHVSMHVLQGDALPPLLLLSRRISCLQQSADFQPVHEGLPESLSMGGACVDKEWSQHQSLSPQLSCLIFVIQTLRLPPVIRRCRNYERGCLIGRVVPSSLLGLPF